MTAEHWFTTRSALFKPGDHVWNEVVRYEQPLRSLPAERYGHPRWGLDDADREDLLQSILIEIKEQLLETYERSRGQFRALLGTVLRRKVAKFAREKRRGAGPDLEVAFPAPEADDVEALDLETSLLCAVSECHEHFVSGTEHELEVVWVLTDRLVHALGNKAIAAKRGYTERQVAGRLTRARDRIFLALLARELELSPESPDLVTAVNAFKACLRTPRQRTRIAERLPHGLSEPFAEFLNRFLATLRLFRGSDSARYQELARGVLEVFAEAPAEVLLGEAV